MRGKSSLGSPTQRGGACVLGAGVIGILISPHSPLSWLFLAAGLVMTGVLVWDWLTGRPKLASDPSTAHPPILITFGRVPPMSVATFTRRLALTIAVVALTWIFLAMLLAVAEGI
jgi:hypothetical protein